MNNIIHDCSDNIVGVINNDLDIIFDENNKEKTFLQSIFNMNLFTIFSGFGSYNRKMNINESITNMNCKVLPIDNNGNKKK